VVVTKFLGSAAWVLVTASILLVLPVMLEVEKEQAVIAQENSMKMSSQQMTASAQQVGRALRKQFRPALINNVLFNSAPPTRIVSCTIEDMYRRSFCVSRHAIQV